MTLPGFSHIPDPAPARTAVGYLSWLAEQPYPDGWVFWCLAQALTERAEKAEQAIQRVRDMPATPPSGGYYMVSMRDVLRALDGGAS